VERSNEAKDKRNVEECGSRGWTKTGSRELINGVFGPRLDRWYNTTTYPYLLVFSIFTYFIVFDLISQYLNTVSPYGLDSVCSLGPPYSLTFVTEIKPKLQQSLE
jgi:hypothetical protein